MIIIPIISYFIDIDSNLKKYMSIKKIYTACNMTEILNIQSFFIIYYIYRYDYNMI